MKVKQKYLMTLGLSSTVLLLWANGSRAQIIPDRTLPQNSVVTTNDNTMEINGGTRAGENLFHSFQEFSVPTDTEAFFNNRVGIDNIITRVTGGKISNIDGLIRANGTANLFLLNPNGILFGPNARLDIGGSFLGSTADSMLFNDGSFYSAAKPNRPPLLTINVPIGLQWQGGRQAGEIRVEGTGHDLAFADFNGRVLRGDRISGLQVRSGNSLALIGGDITLAGGTLTSQGDRIELGSVSEGVVTLVPPTGDGGGSWSFGYERAIDFGEIELLDRAAVDASGRGSGAIGVRGRNLTIRDGSVMLIQSFGSQPGGSINLEVTAAVQLEGTTSELTEFRPGVIPSVRMPSGLQTQAMAEGNGGDISISARRLSLTDGAAIQTRNFSRSGASAGNITVNAADVELKGDSPALDLVISLINSSNVAIGSVGNITINTDRLRVREGAAIGTTQSNGNNDGGNLTVNATESVEIVGFREEDTSSLGVFSIRGRGGSLLVNTGRLVLQDAARIDASSFDDGSGRVEINASEEVVIRGKAPQGAEGASISASVFIFPDADFRQFIGIPELPNGDSGDVIINTPVLRLRDAGQITVTNQGTGRGGNLQVKAEKIVLDNEARIAASTASGEGGNINLQVGDLLELRRDSFLSVEGGGSGNGGNITINSDTLVLLDHSRITANAISGDGGEISITTRGLFQSADSEITASSRFGVSGTISISNPDLDPDDAIASLSSAVRDPSEQITKGCTARENTFVVTGRGGLAEDPTATIRGSTLWRDMEDYTTLSSDLYSSVQSSQETIDRVQQSSQILEATGWVKHPDGTIELVAYLPNVGNRLSKAANCSL